MLKPIDSYKPPNKRQDKPKTKLQSDFKIGNMAIELVEYTLEICNKDDKGNPRFPARLYESYVTEFVRSAIAIHRCICYANSVRHDASRRIPAQEQADGEAVNLEHLILTAYHKGWISEKQHTQWQTKICNLHYSLLNWMSS